MSLEMDHKYSFKSLFEGQTDWEAYFEPGFADESHEMNPEHLADIGMRLVTLYRENFEEDHGYYSDLENYRPTRACDIKHSTLADALGLPTGGAE